MFKPLLKTLPSLSGNIKIACKLDGYKSIGQNTYECFVNEANLIPLSHNLYDHNIKINLKNNSYEYDIKNFYNYYSDIFYKTNFDYSKVNIPIIDFTSQINDTNKDFQYGCKRVSYLKSNGNQFAFYAPIYAENLEDIDNKVFRIKVIFEKTNKLVKYINIPISSKYNSVFNENYLINYIEKYYSKIDSKVLYFSPSYKNMYYGINLLEGGFIRVEDNISSNLYNKYYTINDFDCIINNGFKRNSIAIKQIFNLSFYFNPYNILTEYEKQLYKNCIVKISGRWYNGDNKVDFYDFSDNYNLFTEKVFKMRDKQFNYFIVSKNIMNLSYPAFNEASSENFKYINTVSKNYNRWKLKYSNDENPYITNLNFAFSMNQDSLYTYKEYPQFYNPLYCTCSRNNNEEYEMIFSNTNKEYNNILNEKHISSFFNVLTKEDNSNEYLDIFDSKYQGFWGDINKEDNKIYYQGILYDFNQFYQKYNINTPLDKFSIFVIPEFSYVLNNEYNNIYKTIKFLYNIKLEDNQNIDYDFVNNNLENIQNYVTLEKDDKGDYIYNPSILQYSNSNEYYDVNDIKIKLYNEHYNINIFNDEIVDGYKLLDVYWSNNIISNLFEDIIEIYNTKEYSDKTIFRHSRFTDYDSIYTISDKLYFSIYPSKTKYNLLENYSIIGTENRRINLYYKTQFIKKIDLPNEINIDGLNKYYYSTGLYNEEDNLVYTGPLFIKQSFTERNYGEYTRTIRTEDENNIDLIKEIEDENTDVIYVDAYNLPRVIDDVYGKGYADSHTGDFEIKANCVCKFLNKEHINVYFEKLHKEFENDLTQSLENILNTIYICIRSFTNIEVNLNDENLNTISIHNNLCKLSDFGINTLKDINSYIDYNSYDGYFYFNEKWIKEKISSKSIDYNIIRFDIVFKRDMYIMNDILYELIIKNKESNKTYKDLFLYHIYNPIDYKYEMNYQIIDYTNNSNSIDELTDNLKFNDELNTNILLIPYFNSIYEEGKTSTKIYNDYFLDNIYRMEDIERYRYNLPNIDIAYKNPLIPIKVEESDNIEEGFSIKDIIIQYEEINNISITQQEINNIITSENSLLYLYNLINLYNYIIDNNIDPYYNKDTNELSNTQNLSIPRYYTNNPSHYIYMMSGSRRDDGLGTYIATSVICKIANNIEDIYNTELYSSNLSSLGTVRDLFNNSINLSITINYIKSYIIIYYNQKYYLIALSTYIKSYISTIENKLYFLRYNNTHNFSFSTGNTEYIENHMNYDEIPENTNIETNNRYSFIKGKENNFITQEELSKIIKTENVENIKIYDNNFITYNYNSSYYGFYIIKVPFDNTKNSLNLVNNKGNSINSVDYIDGINVSLMNQYSYSYLGKIFKNILPYINSSNLVTYVSNNIDTIIKPNIYKLYNKYKQYPNKENDKVISYTIYNYDKKYNIDLLRYFDEIVPYIPKSKMINSYFLYYKNTDNVIENELSDNHISYIMYNKNVTLTKHTNPVYFDYTNREKKYPVVEFEQLEYKHYNDNKYFCLEKEFTYDFGEVGTYMDMINIENNEEKAFEIFKNYMRISLSNISLDETRFLFLYKKYGRKYSHTNLSGNKYKVKIKYYLL